MATKLLLIEDVEDLGRKGEIVSVKEGYARNFLLPKRFAVIADPNALRRQQTLQEERKKQAVKDKADAEVLAKDLEKIEVEATVKVDPEGHMYGSVSAVDIVTLVKDQHKFDLDKRFVVLKQPIRELGQHQIELKLKEGVPASLCLHVLPEGGLEVLAAIEAAKASENQVVGEIPAEATEESAENSESAAS